MKKYISILLAAVLCMSLTACGTNSEPENSEPEITQREEADSEKIQSADTNILIAYFSVPEDIDTTDAISGASIVVSNDEKLGNTEYVADLIQKTVGGDLFRIETVQDYPLDHETLVDQASDEKSESFRPELATHVDQFDKYQYVFLGCPVWWSDMPMAVYSFLEEYDFGAKTIIPFITHGGSQSAGTLDTISELQPGALMGDALVISRDDVAESEDTVVEWAQNLGINPKR